MLKSVHYRIGRWTFVPSAHELRCGTARVRLQQRASATLSLLCERAGDVASRQELVDRAWGRRHLSDNSVAIVIGDLRRALDIPDGAPGSIETVPKAGYRLVVTPGAAQAARAPHWRLIIAALIVIAGIAAAAALYLRAHPARPQVLIARVENATGSGRYEPFIQASGETLVVALGRHSDELRIAQRAPPATADYTLRQRWVLWSGAPELVLTATDRSGNIVWSGAIYGPEDQFPARISDKVEQFAARARTR